MLKRIAILTIGLLPSLSGAEARDPTMPGNLPPMTGLTPGFEAPMQLNVTAIRIGDSSRIAIINGSTVKTGEWLNDDIRILKIMPHYVVVNYHGDRKKFYLVSPIRKQ